MGDPLHKPGRWWYGDGINLSISCLLLWLADSTPPSEKGFVLFAILFGYQL